jgi:serine/threonine protein kinase
MILQALNEHPNIVNLIDVVNGADDYCWLVFRYMGTRCEAKDSLPFYLTSVLCLRMSLYVVFVRAQM